MKDRWDIGVIDAIECANQVIRAYGPASLGEVDRENLCTTLDHYLLTRRAPSPDPAPDMLAALYAIIYASDRCQGHRNCDHDMSGWTLAREVIAKIEGETV